MWNIPSERSVQVCRVQEGGLPLWSLWILMFLLPRKTHAIFLSVTYNALKKERLENSTFPHQRSISIFLVFDEKFNWEQTSFLKERGE